MSINFIPHHYFFRFLSLSLLPLLVSLLAPNNIAGCGTCPQFRSTHASLSVNFRNINSSLGLVVARV